MMGLDRLFHRGKRRRAPLRRGEGGRGELLIFGMLILNRGDSL
jgi:hypothetical protein